MALTPMEKKLALTLRTFDIQKDEFVAVILFLQREEQQEMILQVLEKNKSATQNDILKEMLRIYRMTK